mmetsp:Transcript_6287/g.9950  ORF Transcript_6287/g.9950 Transcript_6287/m.9950 type:complete len:82 (-) Transcript_6287:53-298(-)
MSSTKHSAAAREHADGRRGPALSLVPQGLRFSRYETWVHSSRGSPLVPQSLAPNLLLKAKAEHCAAAKGSDDREMEELFVD